MLIFDENKPPAQEGAAALQQANRNKKRLRMKKQMKLVLMAGIMILGLGSSLQACTGGQKDKQEAKQETKQEGSVESIDAKFVRANIWDYKEEPTKFVFKGDRPVVIDFYADWCGPCRTLSPRLKEVAAQYKGQVKVYKVNVDNEPELARAFGVSALPTLIYIPLKGTPSNSIGLLSIEQLKEAFDKIIK